MAGPLNITWELAGHPGLGPNSRGSDSGAGVRFSICLFNKHPGDSEEQTGLEMCLGFQHCPVQSHALLLRSKRTHLSDLSLGSPASFLRQSSSAHAPRLNREDGRSPPLWAWTLFPQPLGRSPHAILFHVHVSCPTMWLQVWRPTGRTRPG